MIETPVVLSGGTEISWAHFTFNGWWGCIHVSPACDACYAEILAARFAPGMWEKDGPRRFFGDKHWDEPLKWNRRAVKNGTRYRVFSASMSDVFEDHPDVGSHRERLWALIEATPNLDWMLLTKRPQNIRRMVPAAWLDPGDWPPYVWAGCTVENQRYANVRIPQLLGVPAPIRFLSVEPMLGPVDLSRWLWRFGRSSLPVDPYGNEPSGLISWVICGGESGRTPRPMLPSWARSLRDQCVTAGVSFHAKQWGEWMPYTDAYNLLGYDDPVFARAAREVERGEPKVITAHDPTDPDAMIRVGKNTAGRLLDGREWNEFPETPT